MSPKYALSSSSKCFGSTLAMFFSFANEFKRTLLASPFFTYITSPSVLTVTMLTNNAL
ncbi:hypothetical protein DSECCO2_590530 [anaerobic digester metagenome]